MLLDAFISTMGSTLLATMSPKRQGLPFPTTPSRCKRHRHVCTTDTVNQTLFKTQGQKIPSVDWVDHANPVGSFVQHSRCPRSPWTSLRPQKVQQAGSFSERSSGTVLLHADPPTFPRLPLLLQRSLPQSHSAAGGRGAGTGQRVTEPAGASDPGAADNSAGAYLGTSSSCT